MLPCPEVDVVSAENRARELGIGVSVLQREPTAGKHPNRVAGGLEAPDRYADCLGPGCRAKHVAVLNQRAGEAVVQLPVAMREAIFVSDPLLIDVWIIPGQAAHHDAASMINPNRRTAGVMSGDRGGGNQIERPRSEAVLRTGQRAHRADLNGVAGEVGLEGFLLVDPDLL